MEQKNLNNLNTSEENSRLKIILDDDTNNLNEGTRIGDKAPQFLAKTTMGDMKLSDYSGNWLILFSHPGSYTPVCTTEFLSFSKMYPEFKRRNCHLLGLSIDSTPSHLAWINNIYKSTGTQIPFPIISDLDMKISKKYNMIAPNASNTQTIRTVFFIDPNQKIRARLDYPMKNGRNIGELLRLLEAMQTSDSQNVATPVNWVPGSPTIVSSPNTYQELIERINNQSNYNCMDWYLCFNRLPENIDTNKTLCDYNKVNIKSHNMIKTNTNMQPYSHCNMNPSFNNISHVDNQNINCCKKEEECKNNCCCKTSETMHKCHCMRDDI